MISMTEEAFHADVTAFAEPHLAHLPSANTMDQELTMWYSRFSSEKSLIEAYQISVQSVNYPNISYLLKVMLTLAVTSATTERANSSLKFIKSKLRSTISQRSLNAFVLAYKHKDILYKLSSEAMCNDFIMKKRRRLLIHNPLSM